MRVLYSFPHPVGSTGIGTTAINQVRALAAAGAQVTLCCTSLHGEIPGTVKVQETLRFGGRRIPHRVFGTPDRALVYHDHRVAQLLKRSPDRFDVVHTWPQSALATFRAAQTVGCLSSREVPNTHTANAYAQAEQESRIVGVALPAGHSHRVDGRRLSVEEKEYAEADVLMVPSDHVRSTFVARGVDSNRLKRHQYGYDQSRFSTQGRTETPKRPFTAAFVGRAEPRKGLHYALQAWIAADPPKGSQFLIAGDFSHGYEQYVARWLTHPSVKCLGFVDNVSELLRKSDVLLLPSVEEGSALVTYEAQASGCIPLVSTAAGALLPPGLVGFMHTPRDVGALTEHLREVVRNLEVRETLRGEMLGWVAELTWEAAGRRMFEIYQDALAKRVVLVNGGVDTFRGADGSP